MSSAMGVLRKSVAPEPLFSIIVPVYNTGPFILNCIESLLNQTETRFEVVAVDDGSTDNSLELLNERSLKDPRLRVFSKKNGGQGSARNLGLGMARGSYIAFVDSDDTVSLDLLASVLPNFDDPDLDVVSFGIDFVDESGRLVARRVINNSATSSGPDIFVDAMLDRRFLSSVCNKIYRRSLLICNSILFPELKAYEDSVFSRNVARHARKVLYLKECLYYALTRQGSTSRGMSRQSFSLAADMIELERSMFCTGIANPVWKAAFKAHVARFFAYLIILSAFRIDDRAERDACIEIANAAGFAASARDQQALALLDARVRAQIFLAKHPRLLRVLARMARRFGVVPY